MRCSDGIGDSECIRSRSLGQSRSGVGEKINNIDNRCQAKTEIAKPKASPADFLNISHLVCIQQLLFYRTISRTRSIAIHSNLSLMIRLQNVRGSQRE